MQILAYTCGNWFDDSVQRSSSLIDIVMFPVLGGIHLKHNTYSRFVEWSSGKEKWFMFESSQLQSPLCGKYGSRA